MKLLILILINTQLLGAISIVSNKNYIIKYAASSPYEINQLKGSIKYASDYINERLGIRPSFIRIHVYRDVFSFARKFNLQYNVGGYFRSGTIYLQPINVLIKKKALNKILIIELTHLIIYESQTNIPLWFDESLAHYIAQSYSTEFKRGISIIKRIDRDFGLRSIKRLLFTCKDHSLKEALYNLYGISLSE